jgi:hypothetical protein
MLRNLPKDYTRAMVLELLDSRGLAGKYNFVYLLYDFDMMACSGEALVNFESYAAGELARVNLQGFSQWKVQSLNVCEVSWSEALQGLDAHIDRYRNSSLMHQDVPEQFRPIILKNGTKAPFPPPSRRVRAPRSKGVAIWPARSKTHSA